MFVVLYLTGLYFIVILSAGHITMYFIL